MIPRESKHVAIQSAICLNVFDRSFLLLFYVSTVTERDDSYNVNWKLIID